MLAGGALAFAFIPVYSEFLDRDDNTGANNLVSSVLNLVLIV